MKPRLLSQIEDLYKGPLDEFTKARNTLAKSLAGSEKKEVSALVKPSLPMWVVNQLYWQDAPAYKALIDASDKLRSAHRSALAGRDVDTRKADQLHRTTVERAFSRAVALAGQRGVRLTDPAREAVRRTLTALPTDEPAGRITREPPAAGFSLLTGVAPRPRGQQKAGPAQAKPSAEALRRQRLAEKQAERTKKEAEREARRTEEHARKEREKRERAIARAEQALRDAERRLAELKR